jgi:hypothetical protein
MTVRTAPMEARTLTNSLGETFRLSSGLIHQTPLVIKSAWVQRVPEPTTSSLFGIGGVCCFLKRRHRSQLRVTAGVLARPCKETQRVLVVSSSSKYWATTGVYQHSRAIGSTPKPAAARCEVQIATLDSPIDLVTSEQKAIAERSSQPRRRPAFPVPSD